MNASRHREISNHRRYLAYILFGVLLVLVIMSVLLILYLMSLYTQLGRLQNDTVYLANAAVMDLETFVDVIFTVSPL